MKKYLLILLLFSFLFLNLSASASTYRVKQIIYDPAYEKEQKSITNLSSFDLGYSLYRIHLFLGHGLDFVSVSTYEYSDLLISLRDVASYNILDLLEYETDKMSVMDKYLSSLDKYLLRSEIALSNIKEELSSLSSSMKQCLSQKASSDALYIDYLESQYNQYLLQDIVEDSKKYGQCASDAKIEYNSKKILSDKISTYRYIVDKKYTYLHNNKYDIVDNYNLMRGDVLEQLVLIKRMLQKYNL